MNQIKHLIFDFDGVLGDTWSVRNEAMMQLDNKTLEQVIVESDAYFSQPSHTRKHDFSKDQIMERLEWSREFGKIVKKLDFDLFHEFIEELKKIKEKKMAIVSSGTRIYIENKVKKLKLDFTHVLTLEDHYSKEEKVELVCRDWGVEPKDVYYFTDAQSDVLELKDIMDVKKIIGCSWGYQGFYKLIEVLPEKQILKDFEDVHSVLENI